MYKSMSEEWRPVSGYDGLYEVSSLGRVRNSKTFHVLKQHPWGSGHLHVWLSCNRKVKSMQAHRLVAVAFISDPPEGHEVNHKDGNKRNNTSNNLEWVTHRENMVHAVKLGLIAHARGESHCRAKLTSAMEIMVKHFGRALDAAGKARSEPKELEERP